MTRTFRCCRTTCGSLPTIRDSQSTETPSSGTPTSWPCRGSVHRARSWAPRSSSAERRVIPPRKSRRPTRPASSWCSCRMQLVLVQDRDRRSPCAAVRRWPDHASRMPPRWRRSISTHSRWRSASHSTNRTWPPGARPDAVRPLLRPADRSIPSQCSRRRSSRCNRRLPSAFPVRPPHGCSSASTSMVSPPA